MCTRLFVWSWLIPFLAPAAAFAANSSNFLHSSEVAGTARSELRLAR